MLPQQKLVPEDEDRGGVTLLLSTGGAGISRK